MRKESASLGMGKVQDYSLTFAKYLILGLKQLVWETFAFAICC